MEKSAAVEPVTRRLPLLETSSKLKSGHSGDDEAHTHRQRGDNGHHPRNVLAVTCLSVAVVIMRTHTHDGTAVGRTRAVRVKCGRDGCRVRWVRERVRGQASNSTTTLTTLAVRARVRCGGAVRVRRV